MNRKTRLHVESLDDRCLPSFSPAVNYPVGASPQEVVSADFNNDSVLDVAYIDGGVSVLLGNADGTFQAAITSPTGNRPSSMEVGDFNGDGNLDLVSADGNYGGYIDSVDVTVLLGNGNGTFGTPTGYEATSGYYSMSPNGVLSVAVGDFNGDGHLDIAATSYVHEGSGSDSGYLGVLLGTGAGTFGASQFGGGIVNWTSELVAADFNADDKLDLAAPVNGYIEIALGDGNGMFGSQYFYDSSNNGSSIVAADFNADGKVDLAAGGNSCVSVQLGNGNGYFGTTRTYSAGAGSLSDLAVADFNSDGNLDLIASNSSDGTVSVLLGTGAGAFTLAAEAAVGAGPVGVAAGDFNGDGQADAVSADATSGTVSVLLNDGEWGFPPLPTPSLTLSDATVTEGNTGTRTAAFTVTLSAASGQTVTVSYATADGTAGGGDYQAASGMVTFAPGETNKAITVEVTGDRLAEPHETFVVNLTGPTNVTVADGQGVGTITDDEPRISIGDVTKKEGNGKKTTLFTFTVTLSAAYDQAVTVSYQTVNGSATTGDGDYVAKSGTLTFAPGETTKTITIEVKGDSRKEADEYFYLDLFDNSGTSLFTKNRGRGTIQNDD
jgi:hypothetical protein